MQLLASRHCDAQAAFQQVHSDPSMLQEAAYYGIPKGRPVTRPINQPPEEAEPEDTGPKYYEEPSQPADSYAKFHPTDKNFRNAPQQVP